MSDDRISTSIFGTAAFCARAFPRWPGSACRSLFTAPDGWRRDGLCARASANQRQTLSLDNRPADADRNGRTLRSSDTLHPRSLGKACRRTDGSRGRAALRGHFSRRGRDLGQSESAGFHRQQAPCHARRNGGHSVLADPSWRKARPQRRARTLAAPFASVTATQGRRESAGRAALACRAVPLTRSAAGPMDRVL